MRDLMKWNLALARLSNFIERFPFSPDEDHIFQYHEISRLFEEASEDVLSQFRIAPDRLNRRISDASRSCSQSLDRWEIIEFAYFSRQAVGLIGYATNKLHDYPSPFLPRVTPNANST
jgi:hypothetical protein